MGLAGLSVEGRIADLFAQAGLDGSMHAYELLPDDATAGSPRSALPHVALRADRPVAAASTIKLVIAVAFARAVAGDSRLSALREQARLMLTVSDNAATDLLYAQLGASAIDAVLSDLGLKATHMRSDMGSAQRRVIAQLGLPDDGEFDAQLEAADPATVRGLAWLDPARANATTAREMTSLLKAVWSDRAASAPECSLIREAMARQQGEPRLARGFGPSVRVAAKNGTLPFVRNEVGVISCPDGRRFAVAVFTRTGSASASDPQADAAIGAAAGLAVDWLRSGSAGDTIRQRR